MELFIFILLAPVQQVQPNVTIIMLKAEMYQKVFIETYMLKNDPETQTGQVQIANIEEGKEKHMESSNHIQGNKGERKM